MFPQMEGRASATFLSPAAVISQLPADRFGSSMVKVYGKGQRICIWPLLRVNPECAPDGKQGLLLLKKSGVNTPVGTVPWCDG